MTFFQTYAKEIVSLLIPVVLAVGGYYFRPRTKLRWSVSHNSVMLVDEAYKTDDGKEERRDVDVRFRRIFLENAGRAPAKNIEVVFNWRPRKINLWPQRIYSEAINPEGRFIVSLPNMATKEFVGIDLFSIRGEVPDVVNIRSEEGFAKEVQMRPQIVYSNWVNGSVLALMFLGAMAFVYLLITAIQVLPAWFPAILFSYH